MKNVFTPLLISLIGGSLLTIVLSIFLFPFVVILATNTLFPQAALDYNLWNWLAVIDLAGCSGTETSIERANTV